jgi:predicted DsbA family dithiol-disulfide isomerase
MVSLAQLRIDIVSDVVCPWCIIGYKQLERAIGALSDRAEVSVRWHPFQLAPDVGLEGQSLADYARERYGATPEQSSQNREQLIGIGQSLGVDFRYSPESRMVNTRRAHELLAWAGETGGQTALKLGLFRAYFTDQADIAQTDVLLAAVTEAGLDGEEARAVLTENRFTDQVEQELSYWQNQNITGVPAFIVNGKYMIPGAQDADTFVRYLDKVIEKEAALAA